MVEISSKSKVYDFSEGQKPPIRGLTIIKRSWNYGNLPYLVANTYGINLIKIGGISIFRGGRGGGGYMWPTMPIFELGWAIPVKSHGWKFGLDWLNWRYVNFQGGQKPPIRGGYMWPAMPIFELGRAISLKSHMWQFGSEWLSLSRVIVSTNKQTNIHKKRKSLTRLKTITLEKFFLADKNKTSKASPPGEWGLQ